MAASADLTIRPAVAADAAAIAAVHVRAWAETYPGVMPAEALATAPTVQERTEMWAKVLAAGHDAVFVAELAGRVVGFSWAGFARTSELGAEGEIVAINLLNEAKRRGLGRRLLATAFAALRDRGLSSVGLWCVLGNAPAERFYESLGGQRANCHDLPHGPVLVREIAFLWSPIPIL